MLRFLSGPSFPLGKKQSRTHLRINVMKGKKMKEKKKERWGNIRLK